MDRRRWWIVLGALAALRLAPPLAALAAEGSDLPGLPRFDLVAGTGDDAGYYAAVREFMAAWGRVPLPLLALVTVGFAAVAAVTLRAWHRGTRRAWLVVLPAAAFAAAVVVAVLEMEPTGTPVFGWSLVWSLPLLPYRALGLPLDYEIAFAFGFPLSLAANAVALVATAYAGWFATGRRAIGLIAAGALAVWPLVSMVVAGERAWDNGSWLVDTGLALYTEPLSTALVATAAALLLAPASGLALAGAGALLSLATLVKLSNGYLALLVVFVVAQFRGLRDALTFLAGALTFAPVVLAYWPLSYYDREEDQPSSFPENAFSFDYAGANWLDSTLFSPRTLLVLLPLALVGGWWLRRRRYPLALLAGLALANAAFYTIYEPTADHPRFLYASLPPLFVLVGAGAAAVADRVRLVH
jgi:hypothetical protein